MGKVSTYFNEQSWIYCIIQYALDTVDNVY